MTAACLVVRARRLRRGRRVRRDAPRDRLQRRRPLPAHPRARLPQSVDAVRRALSPRVGEPRRTRTRRRSGRASSARSSTCDAAGAPLLAQRPGLQPESEPRRRELHARLPAAHAQAVARCRGRRADVSSALGPRAARPLIAGPGAAGRRPLGDKGDPSGGPPAVPELYGQPSREFHIVRGPVEAGVPPAPAAKPPSMKRRAARAGRRDARRHWFNQGGVPRLRGLRLSGQPVSIRAVRARSCRVRRAVRLLTGAPRAATRVGDGQSTAAHNALNAGSGMVSPRRSTAGGRQRGPRDHPARRGRAGLHLRRRHQRVPRAARRCGGDGRLRPAVGRAWRAIGETPQPVIAMINGLCFGGGVAVALACDLRFAADGCALRHSRHHARSLVSDGEHRAAGARRRSDAAADILLSARRSTRQEALHIGLVNRVVPAPTSKA